MAVVGGLLAGAAVLVAAATLLSASVGSRMAPHRPPAPPHDEVLPDHGLLPEFSLIDHQGRSFTRQTLQGSVWIADFIFTRCAGQCPMMTGRMTHLQRKLSGLGVRLVSVSVDPQYDTAERLAAYAAQAGADARSWSFVTGEPEAVLRLAREGFRLGVGEDGTEAEPITHSIRLVLVDRAGHIRGYYEATDPAAMMRLEADARRLLREPAT